VTLALSWARCIHFTPSQIRICCHPLLFPGACVSHVVFPWTVPNSPPFCHVCLHASYLILFQWLQWHSRGLLASHHSASSDTNSFVFWRVLLNYATNYWRAISSGFVLQHDIRYVLLGTHKWYCRSTTALRTALLCISVYAEAWKALDTRCLNILPLCANLHNTGLFKMIVGVLTTCHTQYTWDSSICNFFI